MKGMGKIVRIGTVRAFSWTSPVVALVVLYTNCTLRALPSSSRPTDLMKLMVCMAAWPCALITAVRGPAHNGCNKNDTTTGAICVHRNA